MRIWGLFHRPQNSQRPGREGERLDDFNVDTVERIVGRESWMKRNAIPLVTAIISLAVMLATFSATYGRIITSMAAYESELASYRTELTKVEARIAEVNIKVDQHHMDTTRHLDERQWDLLQKQILAVKEMSEEINSLLRSHMRTTGRPVN